MNNNVDIKLTERENYGDDVWKKDLNLSDQSGDSCKGESVTNGWKFKYIACLTETVSGVS